MTDIERRALLGDRHAQEECTRKGIVLPCPCCGGREIETKYACGDYWCECAKCGTAGGFIIDRSIAIDAWNNRPAPPIGRCKDCANWYKQHCASGPYATEPTDAEFFCGRFKPKNGEEDAEI